MTGGHALLLGAVLFAGCAEPPAPPRAVTRTVLEWMESGRMTKPLKARKRPPIETCEGFVRHGEWARLRLPEVNGSHGWSYPCGTGHVAYGAGAFWPVVAKLLVQQPGCERCTMRASADFAARDAVVMVHVHRWDEQGGDFEAEVDRVTPPGRAGPITFVSAYFLYVRAGEPTSTHHMGFMTAFCGETERVAPECLRFYPDYVIGQDL